MSKGYMKRYFLCGTYRKTGRKQCHANSVPWSKLDHAVTTLLAIVRDRLDALATEPKVAQTVLSEKWAKQTELGRIICRIVNQFMFGVDSECFDQEHDDGVIAWVREHLDQSPSLPEQSQPSNAVKPSDSWDMATCLEWSIEFYNKSFAENSGQLQKELAAIDGELDRIAQAIIEGIPSQTVRGRLNQRMAELEARKREISPRLVPLTETVQTLMGQLQSMQATLETANTAAKARLLDSFIDRVLVSFEGELVPGRGRDVVFEFQPKGTAREVMPQPMKLVGAPRGRGSWRRPG
jgi:hypothetical protein